MEDSRSTLCVNGPFPSLGTCHIPKTDRAIVQGCDREYYVRLAWIVIGDTRSVKRKSPSLDISAHGAVSQSGLLQPIDLCRGVPLYVFVVPVDVLFFIRRVPICHYPLAFLAPVLGQLVSIGGKSPRRPGCFRRIRLIFAPAAHELLPPAEIMEKGRLVEAF